MGRLHLPQPLFSPRLGTPGPDVQRAADILPVYHLGNSLQLSFRGWPWLSRRFRTMVGVMWGQWGLPIPRQCELITLVGEPIPGAQAPALLGCFAPWRQCQMLHARVPGAKLEPPGSHATRRLWLQ